MDLLVSKADIMIFYANAFDSRGEDGSAINGCTVHYMFWGENGTALVGQSEPDVKKPVGMQRGKSWVDYEIRNKIRIAPAIYQGTFKMDVDSKGKPVLKLVDVAYKSNVRMQAYKLNGLVVPGMLEDTEEVTETTTDPVTSVPDTENTPEHDALSKDVTDTQNTSVSDVSVKDRADKNNQPAPDAPARDSTKSRK